jgi:cyanate permease
MGAGGLFASVQLALILHLVPILRQHGLSLATAVRFSALTGLFSIVGRVTTGYLLDRLPTRPLAVFAFGLLFVVLALLTWGGGSIIVLMMAASMLGFCAGSETDIITYLATRKFDPRIFGTVYSLFQVGFAICASIGPLLAGKMFDLYRNYDSYFLIAVPTVFTATVLIIVAVGHRSDKVLPSW